MESKFDKRAYLKRELIKALVVLAVVFGVFGGVYAGAMAFKSANFSELEKLEKDTRRLKEETKRAKDNYDATAKAIVYYDAIDPRRLPSESGLEQDQMRVSASRPIVIELKERFILPELDVTLTNPDSGINQKQKGLAKALKGVKAVDVITNSVTYSYGGITDELVLSFVRAMIEKMPGYFILRRIEMTRDSTALDPIDQEEGRVVLKPLVDGKMEFEWKAIKKLPLKDDNAQEEEQGNDVP